MPVTLGRAQGHVERWSRELAPYPSRSSWPAYLFHICQLEVAVEIIRSGRLVCRNKVPELICDVANQGALWNNPNAHKYVRLYFRPQNSFHLKTEGVKAIGDPFRADRHMSIPIAFAFDFVQVITLPTSGFVPGNFARTGAAPLSTDRDFDGLSFENIYHNSAPSPERMAEIHNWRMSEVVVWDHLDLSSLSRVICRTTQEERTLRHLLAGVRQLPKIAVEQKGAVFMRRGMFIDEIYWENDLLYLKFHGPVGFTRDKYSLVVHCSEPGITRTKRYCVAPGRYRLADLAARSDAVWRVELEDCVVYEAEAPSVSGLVAR